MDGSKEENYNQAFLKLIIVNVITIFLTFLLLFSCLFLIIRNKTVTKLAKIKLRFFLKMSREPYNPMNELEFEYQTLITERLEVFNTRNDKKEFESTILHLKLYILI